MERNRLPAALLNQDHPVATNRPFTASLRSRLVGVPASYAESPAANWGCDRNAGYDVSRVSFAEDGFECVIAGPQARLYHTVMHEIPPGDPPWDITRESPGYHLRATVAFKDVDPSEYAGLFVSGGRAPEYLRYDRKLLEITRHFFEARKPVACLCHGVEILTAAGCIKGRTVTTVAKCASMSEQGGARYVDEPRVIDGNLVTARTWHDIAC